MLSEKFRQTLKDALLVALVFGVITGAYVGFAYAERYRGLTAAYLAQSEALLEILNKQRPPKPVTVEEGKETP